MMRKRDDSLEHRAVREQYVQKARGMYDFMEQQNCQEQLESYGMDHAKAAQLSNAYVAPQAQRNLKMQKAKKTVLFGAD